MPDPFSALLNTLDTVFQLEPMRNGKYIFPAVQHLKEATERYHPDQKSSFVALLRAIREALPNIEKWRVHFESLRHSMDELAKKHQMPPIDWNKLLAHPKVSPKFQFSALNHAKQELDLLVWLTAKTGKPFAQLNHRELTQAIIDNRDNYGFSQKLNHHLNNDPDFLFNLIMKSEKNFIKIAQTRLILYLTDQQIAKAIVHHTPVLIHKRKEPFEQVELLIHKLNEILSNGRSVSTLLRNSEAKPILEQSTFFLIYQSVEYKNREDNSPLTPQHP